MKDIAVGIVIGHRGAADRVDADSLAFDAEFVDRFRNESVNDTMGASRAVMQRDIT